MFVGAHHQIGAVDHRVVENDGHFAGFEIHGTGISGHASDGCNGGIVGKFELRGFGQIAELCFVDFKVAPDHGVDQFTCESVLVENSFSGVFGFETEEGSDLLNGLASGGVDLFQLLSGSFFVFPRCHGDFTVGTVGVVR